ncbi:hypothetical protein EXN66_Car011563 [Channa argus]|uniref:Uncharacterized protein n=1 Tax=Channa argus TaxID=215402 RepID=A0A6G1Q059_CHAAH|nr:hypothetical protein EXN66_Car011563 [Channa argus]
MTVKHLLVEYNKVNEQGTFSPGDILSGKVTVMTSKETKVQCFLVKAKGKAKVTWCDQEGEATVVHSDKKIYFYFEYIILQDKNRGNGEAIAVSVEVLNNSAGTVTPKFYLCEKQTFVAKSKGIVHTNDILFATGDSVPAETSQTITKVLSIPLQLPPTFFNCSLMKLEYRLKSEYHDNHVGLLATPCLHRPRLLWQPPTGLPQISRMGVQLTNPLPAGERLRESERAE